MACVPTASTSMSSAPSSAPAMPASRTHLTTRTAWVRLHPPASHGRHPPAPGPNLNPLSSAPAPFSSVLDPLPWTCPSPSAQRPADINECLAGNGGCAVSCVNTEGGYWCGCGHGFLRMPDGRVCAGRPVQHLHPHCLGWGSQGKAS